MLHFQTAWEGGLFKLTMIFPEGVFPAFPDEPDP